ncbi:hypothetical protein GCM10009639_57730 [Kitasatospora putterlickiae]|uniref:Uncharacterized protein n=1 Tax=Kitasatospora putterlickiae TaxID=221725 RepID=A0ABN1YEQ1_9ACTN
MATRRPRRPRSPGWAWVAATISALAGLVASIGVSASKIITAIAELTRSRADLARARREGESGAPAAAPGAGPDPAPGEDA